MGRKGLKDRAIMVQNPQAKEGFTVRIVRSEKEKVSVAKKICDLYSTGKYTLSDVCAYYKVKLGVFKHWSASTLDIPAMMVKRESIPIRCIPEVHVMFKEAKERAENAYLFDLKEKARRGLAAKIEGVEYEETVTEEEYDDETAEMKTVKVRTKKGRHAPDTAAIIFALTNVDGENFKNKQFGSINLKADPNVAALGSLSDEELEARTREVNSRILRLSKETGAGGKYEDAEIIDEDEENPEIED